MTRIDFYLISDSNAGHGKHFAACRLAQKAYRLKHRVYILAEGPAEAKELDGLLWTFHPGSFVPHQIHNGAVDPHLPVLIGHDPPPAEFTDVLISLAPQVPEFFERFGRVAEIVGNEEQERAAARARFRAYRDRGFAVHTHDL